MDVADNGDDDLRSSAHCYGEMKKEGGFTAQRSITVKNEGAYIDLTRSSML